MEPGALVPVRLYLAGYRDVDEDRKEGALNIAVGIAIGVIIGVVIDNIAMGIGIGIAIGIALSFVTRKDDGNKN